MADGGSGADCPRLEIYVHDEHELPPEFDLDLVEKICSGAAGEVSGLMRPGAPLADLDVIEVTLVSDEVIARVHVDFMEIEGATDVITFDHGEIVISTDTAKVQGAENGKSTEHETALYIVHGLLHLAGYADKSDDEFREMARLQEDLLSRLIG